MPILNYTTKVDVFTTLGEIQAQLVKHGARKIMQDYDDSGHITSLSFLIDTPDGRAESVSRQTSMLCWLCWRSRKSNAAAIRQNASLGESSKIG